MIDKTDYIQAFSKSLKLIDESQKIVLIPHHNADGDAVGSSLSLYNLFVNMSKQATVISPNR